MKLNLPVAAASLLMSICTFAQPQGGAYTPAQKQQKRETAEMDRHYNEIKPRASNSNSGPVSGEYNSYQSADNSKMAGIQAAEARQNAIKGEYEEKENKFRKILTDKKIEKTKENYYRIIDAALQAGFNRYWAERTFGDDPAQFEKIIKSSANAYQQYFEAAPTTIIGSGSKSTVRSIIHDTQYGSGHEQHPETFQIVTAKQRTNGYKSFDSVSAFLKAIIDDGKNNFTTITDSTTQRRYSICQCDWSYGLKYYWKNYEAPEYGAFKSNGKDYWKYPFINFVTRGETKEAYKNIFAGSVSELLATNMYTRDNDAYNNDVFAKFTLKKAFQQDAGVSYFVVFLVQEENGRGVFKIKINKQDEMITDPPIENNKPTLKGVQLNTGANGKARKVKIINSKLIYSTINKTDCLNWSWATEQQKKLSGEEGWGTFKPKNGDVGEIIFESKQCYTGVRVIIVKIGDYYAPVEDDALVFED